MGNSINLSQLPILQLILQYQHFITPRTTKIFTKGGNFFLHCVTRDSSSQLREIVFFLNQVVTNSLRKGYAAASQQQRNFCRKIETPSSHFF